jgi:hypothetical protein
MPADIDEILADLKVLGKREISQVMKWRGKILNKEHVEKQKSAPVKAKKVVAKVNEDSDEIE